MYPMVTGRNKTGGTTGSNQYGARGTARTRPASAAPTAATNLVAQAAQPQPWSVSTTSLECREGTSSKFYIVSVVGQVELHHYGRIGAEGTQEIHIHPDPQTAAQAGAAKVKAKSRKYGHAYSSSTEDTAERDETIARLACCLAPGTPTAVRVRLGVNRPAPSSLIGAATRALVHNQVEPDPEAFESMVDGHEGALRHIVVPMISTNPPDWILRKLWSTSIKGSHPQMDNVDSILRHPNCPSDVLADALQRGGSLAVTARRNRNLPAHLKALADLAD